MASAVEQALQFAVLEEVNAAQGAAAALKSCAAVTGHVGGGAGAGGGEAADGTVQVLRAVNAVKLTPAATAFIACAATHAAMVAPSVTPCKKKGVASALEQASQAATVLLSETPAQGEKAPLKSCAAVIGQVCAVADAARDAMSKHTSLDMEGEGVR